MRKYCSGISLSRVRLSNTGIPEFGRSNNIKISKDNYEDAEAAQSRGEKLRLCAVVCLLFIRVIIDEASILFFYHNGRQEDRVCQQLDFVQKWNYIKYSAAHYYQYESIYELTKAANKSIF